MQISPVRANTVWPVQLLVETSAQEKGSTRAVHCDGVETRERRQKVSEHECS